MIGMSCFYTEGVTRSPRGGQIAEWPDRRVARSPSGQIAEWPEPRIAGSADCRVGGSLSPGCPRRRGRSSPHTSPSPIVRDESRPPPARVTSRTIGNGASPGARPSYVTDESQRSQTGRSARVTSRTIGNGASPGAGSSCVTDEWQGGETGHPGPRASRPRFRNDGPRVAC